MRSATATSMPHAATSPVHRADHGPRIGFSDQEEKLLNLNLSDLSIPKMNDLHVDGLNKRSWLARLFGGR
ncbi:MAG TPA: hypothetical protein VG962_10515 [Steroidobacteraceae bacterium]|jgi:hypothetical protein|nr:hypothetical protein [Steroidobacteraceae bacterium]